MPSKLAITTAMIACHIGWFVDDVP